jgi:transposase
MHPKMKHVYVGVDTHKKTHTAVIIDCFGDKLGETTFQNTPSAYEKLFQEVKKHTKRGITAIYGLEDIGASGRALAVFLLGKKKVVKHVQSTLSSSERKNQTILHKTDSYDALCIARVLLNRLDELPEANPIDIYWTLAMLVGRRDALVKASTAIKNQLHALISHHYPSYRQFFTVFDCKTALDFWEKYPSPGRLKGVTVEELGKMLYTSSHYVYSEKKARELLGLVVKDGDTTTEFQESRDLIVVTCVKQIRQNDEEVGKIEKEMKNILEKLGYKLETMIGIDLVAAASIIAEIGDVNRFATADKLAKYSGIAPVMYSSGEKDKIIKNQQGNRRLYTHIRCLAARNICCGRNKDKPVNGIFYDYYQKKLKQGKTEHQALVCVMRRLVNIIYGLLKSKDEYKHPTTSRMGDI